MRDEPAVITRVRAESGSSAPSKRAAAPTDRRLALQKRITDGPGIFFSNVVFGRGRAPGALPARRRAPLMPDRRLEGHRRSWRLRARPATAPLSYAVGALNRRQRSAAVRKAFSREKGG